MAGSIGQGNSGWLLNNNFQSSFQGLGILQGAFGSANIMDRVFSGNISPIQGYSALGIHTLGMIGKAGLTDMGRKFGNWLGAQTPIGPFYGGIGGAVIMGTGGSLLIDLIESNILN